MTKLEQRLKEIMERAAKATPGPWKWERDTLVSRVEESVIETDSGYYPPYKNDRPFIAHSRQDIPFLLEALSVAMEALNNITDTGDLEHDPTNIGYEDSQDVLERTSGIRECAGNTLQKIEELADGKV